MPNRSTAIFAATFLLGTVCLFLPFWQGMLWGALWAFPAYPLFVKVQRRHRTKVAFLAASILLIVVLALLALATRELSVVAQIIIPWWKTEVSAKWPAPPFLREIPVFHATLVAAWYHLVQMVTHPILQGPAKLQGLLHWIGRAGKVAGTLFLACLLFFFFLKESAEFSKAYHRILLFLDPLSREGLEAFRETLLAIEYSVLFGLVGEILLIWLIYWASGVPHPLLFATFCSLVAVVPIAGSLVALSVGGFLILYHEAWATAILSTFLVLTVMGLADNLAKPALARVLSRNGRVPSVFWLVFGMLGGILLIGLPGVFLGPAWLAGGVRMWRLWLAKETPAEE